MRPLPHPNGRRIALGPLMSEAQFHPRRKETCVIQLQRWPLLIASSNAGFHTRTSTILKVKEQINRSESLSHLEFPIPNLNSPRRTWGRIGEMIPIAIGSSLLDLRTVTSEILIR